MLNDTEFTLYYIVYKNVSKISKYNKLLSTLHFWFLSFNIFGIEKPQEVFFAHFLRHKITLKILPPKIWKKALLKKINITFYILPCLLLCNYLLVISVVGRLENRDQICLLVEMKCPFKVGSTTFLKDPTAPEMHFSDILLKKIYLHSTYWMKDTWKNPILMILIKYQKKGLQSIRDP